MVFQMCFKLFDVIIGMSSKCAMKFNRTPCKYIYRETPREKYQPQKLRNTTSYASIESTKHQLL